MQKNFLSASEIAEKAVEIGKNKADLSVIKQLLLGFLAGAFIAFGAEGSAMAVHTIESVGLSKFLAGLIFPAGLIMVVAAGAELFTGNCLMIMAAVERKISPLKMLRSWCIVYLGNFLGGLFVAVLINYSGQLAYTGGLLGGVTIKTAATKINMPFLNAFIMGMLCNWLVCTAIWISFGANDGAGRIFGIFFPIWLFVASGFEHSIANMYYIPAGILAKCNSNFLTKAVEIGTIPEALDNLNWYAMFMKNLVPVTLGNILGGAVFVGMIYWVIYRKNSNKK